ncbi:MAG: PEP/pyruvate-binding domain-containing protein [Spirochaetia bacterium]
MNYSTGIPELDSICGCLNPGDNIVWRVDRIEDYLPFTRALEVQALKLKKKPVYIRFGSHPPLTRSKDQVHLLEADPESGFENFITQIHRCIKRWGPDGFFIFDSLSELSRACYSDRMIGNFFKLTCPYVKALGGVAYLGLYRYFHSYHAANPIKDTTQLLIDVYRYEDNIYLQPTKLPDQDQDWVSTLHQWKDGKFIPITESPHVAEVIGSSPWPGLPSTSYRLVGVWDKVFMRAESVRDAIERHKYPESEEQEVFHQVLRLVISRDRRVFNLAAKYFSLADIIAIWKRMIGTGMIGGKSIGMLLGRAILKKKHPRWKKLLEEHDSFFIGSDVFYTFLVENGCWWDRQKQKNPETFLDGNEKVRQRILEGTFPDYILTRFRDMLDYYGKSPIIVRSSSLLEDNFGNAFAGKYESVFCANQGNRTERMQALLDAVRLIYASTMSVDALNYRKTRGVLAKDEQMALLVQRVSGSPEGRFFFPQLAGVGFSFNPFVWNKEINPEDGMIRLVFGLGTRAVERHDDDYTRVVALNAPEKRPEANFDEVKRHTQKRVDVLNLESNRFENLHFLDIIKEAETLPVNLVAVRDRLLERRAREQGMRKLTHWVLTFDNVFRETSFVSDMRDMLQTLREAYGTHVDIEFTTNFLSSGEYKIHLVQCRPLQVREPGKKIPPIPEIRPEDLVMKAVGGVVGINRSIRIDTLVYVKPEGYSELPEKRRYALARLIGSITHNGQDRNIMLIGPGRWGTSTPSLGIPVSFSEINTVSALCEIDVMHKGLVPDLSLGTHFFNEMVEINMVYVAYFTGQDQNMMNLDYILNRENRLTAVCGDEAAEWEDIIQVIDGCGGKGEDRCTLTLIANALEQAAVLYLEENDGPA